VSGLDVGGGLSDAEEGGVHAGMNVDGRMENLCHSCNASDETRAGARDVTAGVEGIDLAVADSGDGMPLEGKGQREIFIAGLFLGVAAGGDEENVWGGGENFFQGDAEGGSLGLAEQVEAACARNHLWNPMAAYIERLKPLQENDTRAIDDAANLQFDFAEPGADGFHEGFGTEGATGFLANKQDVTPDIAELLRIEAKHFWTPGKSCQGGSKIVGRGCTDVAQILCNDEIGGKLFEEIGVDSVKAFAACDEITDLSIDFYGRGVVWETGMDDDGLGSGARREITFMADADDLVVEMEGEKNLCGRGKERGDAHEADCTTQRRKNDACE